jgi:ribosome-associated protein YbcJ (S4-like RNA binding protein)
MSSSNCLRWHPSGGAAKALIASGAVRVDGSVETASGARLRMGNTVRVANEEVLVTMPAGAAAGPSQGGAANDMELRSSEPTSPPALGRRQGFAEHRSALPKPAGHAEPAVGPGPGGR